MTLTVVSLFDGIGGFPLAFERAGAKTVAAVEIDKAAAAISGRHFPRATQFDDVTKVTGDDLRAVGFVPERGIITAGWPCQDLSVAGRRAGLAGARSGLWWEVVRLLDETRARWFVGENVPGLLSSNDGRDMGAVVGALGELGYGFAYRVLDAQWFGVPQRRRRVFFVGHLGSPFTQAAEVLFECEGGAGDSEAGGGTRPGVAGAARGGVDDAGPVCATGHTHTHTLTASAAKMASEDGTGRGIPIVTHVDTHTHTPVSTLQGGGKRGYRIDAESAAGGHLIVTHTLTKSDGCCSEDGTGRGTPIVALGFHATQDPISTDEQVPCIGSKSTGNGVMVTPLALRGRDGGAEFEIGPEGREGETVGALSLGGGKPGQGYPAVRSTIVRRLTPLECERLQGYPPILQWSEGMTKDEFIAAILASGMVKADPETGRVWTMRGPGGIRLAKPREIKGSNCKGYLVAKFSLGQSKRQLRLHRLIWIAANGIPDAGMAVCHRDDVKTNNRISNLYLATPEQNSTDARESGRYKTGEDNPATKISDELRQTICDDYAHSEAAFRDLAEKYGISKSRVHQIVREHGWTEGQADSARYRQLGNSVAVPCVQWIAERLIAVDGEVTA